MLTNSSPETLEQSAAVASFIYEPAIAFVRDEHPIPDFVMMTPSAVSSFVDNHVRVFMQHGFSAGTQFTDMDYADVGVEFVDDLFQLSQMVRTLVKFEPFTLEQVSMFRDEQIVVSTQQMPLLSLSYLQCMQQHRMSAIGLNFIKDSYGHSVTDKILSETLSPVAASIAMSNFLLPMLMSFVCSPRLRFALQRNPQLMAGTYCFEGRICYREIAELFRMPCSDIVSLCWDLN